MQVGEWLGFVINTVSMQFPVPDKKRKELKSSERCCWRWLCIFTQLAKIADSVISLSLAVGPSYCLFIGQIYYAMESRSSGWDQIIPLSPA